MTTITLPKFHGRELDKPRKITPEVDFLQGDFGLAVDSEVKMRYRFRVITDATKYEEGIIKGSTPHYIVAANELLREEGLRTATPFDLKDIAEVNALNLEDFFCRFRFSCISASTL